MALAFESVIYSAYKRISRNGITSLYQFIAKGDSLVVVRADDSFGQGAVRLYKVICRLYGLGYPVVAVEDKII